MESSLQARTHLKGLGSVFQGSRGHTRKSKDPVGVLLRKSKISDQTQY